MKKLNLFVMVSLLGSLTASANSVRCEYRNEKGSLISACDLGDTELKGKNSIAEGKVITCVMALEKDKSETIGLETDLNLSNITVREIAKEMIIDASVMNPADDGKYSEKLNTRTFADKSYLSCSTN
jgi:hypothetical protein